MKLLEADEADVHTSWGDGGVKNEYRRRLIPDWLMVSNSCPASSCFIDLHELVGTDVGPKLVRAEPCASPGRSSLGFWLITSGTYKSQPTKCSRKSFSSAPSA